MITNEQHEMIDMILEGKPITLIAKSLNKSRATIYTWLKLDFVNQELEKRKTEMKCEARTKIITNVEVCISNIFELANLSKDPRIKFQANKYLLDQAIGSPGTAKEELNTPKVKGEVDTNTLKKELDDIKNLKVIK